MKRFILAAFAIACLCSLAWAGDVLWPVNVDGAPTTFMTPHALVVANSKQGAKSLTDLGTSHKMLHGNAAGNPTWGAIDLATEVTGFFPAGSNTAPGAPVGSTDSGLYNDGSDNLCMAVGGRVLGCWNHVASTAGLILGANAANTVPTSIGGAMSGLENIGTGSTYGHYRQLLLANNATGSIVACAKSRAATNGSFVAIQANDVLCQLEADGDDGASYDTRGAMIRFVASANWTTGVGPTDILLNAMDGSALRQVLCVDGTTGLWLGVNATGQKCGTSGINFLDRSDNGTFNNIYMNADFSSRGTLPSLSGCGTGAALNSGATDTAGEVTEGASATGCIVSFTASKALTPFCQITWWSAVPGSLTLSKSISGITLSHSSASGAVFDYICTQHV